MKHIICLDMPQKAVNDKMPQYTHLPYYLYFLRYQTYLTMMPLAKIIAKIRFLELQAHCYKVKNRKIADLFDHRC